MLSIEEIRLEQKHTGELCDKIHRVLQAAPEGSIYYQQTGRNETFLPYLDTVTDGKRHRTSLRNADERTVKALRYKKYALHIKRLAETNLSALKHAAQYVPITEDIKSFGGKQFEDCREYFFGITPENEAFEALQERQNTLYPEQLKIKTELGVFRSREESMLAGALHDLALRSKYEAPLEVGMYFRYPDFTVLHPVTGEMIYIEFAGLQSDPDYRKSLLKRIDEYASVGVYLGVNLFILSPGPDGSLDMVAITRLLRGIFWV